MTLEALRLIGEAFAGISGRKSLIWATGGVPLVIDEPASVGTGGVTWELYQSAWAALNHADIAVYPLDLSPLINPVYTTSMLGAPARRYRPAAATTWNLENFARMTGGRLCIAKMDAENCLQMAADDAAHYYSLGYYTDSKHGKTGWRKISVSVLRSGVKVQARAGYYIRPPDKKPEVSRDLDVTLAILSPFESTEMPFSVQWRGAPTGGQEKEVGFEYKVAGPEVTIAESEQNFMSLEFAAVALSGQGVPIGEMVKIVEGKLSSTTVATIRDRGVVFDESLKLVPGEYTVRFLVRDNLTGRVGTVSAPLKIE